MQAQMVLLSTVFAVTLSTCGGQQTQEDVPQAPQSDCERQQTRQDVLPDPRLDSGAPDSDSQQAEVAQDGVQECGPGSSITGLKAELHDGDWGHGSIIVSAWIPKPVESLEAVLSYKTRNGKKFHLEGGIVMDMARRTCGAVELVGWDLDNFLLIRKGTVSLKNIVYKDGTTAPGPIEVSFK